jgi:hypothetical protein
VIAPVGMEKRLKASDQRVAHARGGKLVWIKPRRGVREGALDACSVDYRARTGLQNLGRWGS